VSAALSNSQLREAVRECAREPIHIPGRIQPHGVLLLLQEPDLVIQLVSGNVGALTSMPAEELLDQPIDRLLGGEQADRLRAVAGQPDPAVANPLAFELPPRDDCFDAILHRSPQGLILELEPTERRGGLAFQDFYHQVNAAAQRLHRAESLQTLVEVAAEEVRAITGFERVMVYRFDREWNGEVIAEARSEEVDAFLGLRYPASDIPEQARRLYTVNRLRLIQDVNAVPAPLVPDHLPDGAPLDLSLSVLRSVSPVHIQYLKNMEVGASMSISLMRGERLWGLIACHHRAARPVSYIHRIACDFLGQALSLQLFVRESERDYRERSRLEAIRGRLLAETTGEVPLALAERPEELLAVVGATGVALVSGERFATVGSAPDHPTLLRLVRTLGAAGLQEIHATDSLSREYPEGERWKDVASGFLATRISQDNWILWFRPEVVQVVHWAGEPRKGFTREGERMVLHPRQSFELWKQELRLRSTPWTALELEVAAGLRSALVDRFLQQAEAQAREDLERANQQLRRSNEELDSFTHIVSHDLKEPLRGLRNYAEFVLEDYAELLPQDGQAKLKSISHLSHRTQALIDSLLRYSRLGRTDLAYNTVRLEQVVDDARELLDPFLREHNAEVRVERPLPVVWGDRGRLGEVFNNLLTNAVKYNDSSQPEVEIGARREGETVRVWVRDNGIGIRERDVPNAFRMFHRLHTRDRYGGGTGAGLALVKRIVERHGGEIRVQSEEGRGATFLFTLPSARESQP
jgi:light-regulated signal transduction histidine kinase (bacteriophytochrome)